MSRLLWSSSFRRGKALGKSHRLPRSKPKELQAIGFPVAAGLGLSSMSHDRWWMAQRATVPFPRTR